ncbi:MAG: catalase HPII, partial [Flavobacterium sp.]
TPTIESRKVAVICADGVSEAAVANMKAALLKHSAKACIIAPYLGFVTTDKGGELPIDFSFLTSSSVLFDAVYVPGGTGLNSMEGDGDVLEFINDAYKHCKVIGAEAEGIELLSATNFAQKMNNEDMGIVLGKGDANFADEFITAMSKHRFWEREANV